MQIVCPECQFAREVDEAKIPARSQVATCPKCHTKFQFRELPPEEPQEQDFTIEPEPETEPAQQQPEQPAQATLPMDSTPEMSVHEPVEETYTEEPAMPEPIGYDPEEQEYDDYRAEEEDGGPVFPDIDEPAEANKSKLHHPSGEIWDKLHNMTPPGRREVSLEDEEPAQSPFDDDPQPNSQGQEQSHYTEQQPVPGWTGEFNEDFPDPMEADGAKDDEDNQSPLVPPPFEQLDRYGFFHGLYMTIKLALLSPRLFFSVMPVGGGFSKPLTFAILLAMLQATVQVVWGFLGMSTGIEMQGQELTSAAFNLSNGLFEILFTPAVVAMDVFFISGLYHLFLKILKADAQGFEGTFRTMSYSYAPIITGFIPMISLQVLSIWMLVYVVWRFVLTAIGLKHIHRTSYAKVIPALLIPILLLMIIALLATRSNMATI